MTSKPPKEPGMPNKTQSERFIEAAREMEADPDEKRWEDRLRKVAKQKPAPEKPE